MITQYVLNFFARLIAGFVDALPDLPPDVQSGISNIPVHALSAVGYVSKLGPVLPTTEINLSIRFVLVGAVLAIAIRLVRMITSYATGGGGAA